MQNLQKKIILPEAVIIEASLLGKIYDIKLNRYKAQLELPKPARDPLGIGLQALLMPPASYTTGVLEKMDEDLHEKWAQWGCNTRLENGAITQVAMRGLILTVELPSATIEEVRGSLHEIEAQFQYWYKNCSAWIELMTSQDLSGDFEETKVDIGSFGSGWSVLDGTTWRNAHPSSIVLTTNIRTSFVVLDESTLQKALGYANSTKHVDFSDEILIDARRAFNLEDFNRSALYFGQYVESIARTRLRKHLSDKNTDAEIINLFLERKTLEPLLTTCRKLHIDLGTSKKDESTICEIRNISAHALTKVSLYRAREAQGIAEKVHQKFKIY